MRCGNCIPCRITYSYMWSTRILHELPYWNKSCFLTLTYNDDNLPENKSLRPEDLTNFWKRLRKKNNIIKYFSCGEYGEHTKRPHYHAILMGLNQDDHDMLCDTWNMCNWERITCGTVTSKSINYTTGYILKKLTGKKAEEEYTNRGLVPPFTRASQGIGLRWATKHADQLKENVYLRVNGKIAGVPLYYRRKLGIDSANEAHPLTTKEWGGIMNPEMKKYYDQMQKNNAVSRNISARRKGNNEI